MSHISHIYGIHTWNPYMVAIYVTYMATIYGPVPVSEIWFGLVWLGWVWFGFEWCVTWVMSRCSYMQNFELLA